MLFRRKKDPSSIQNINNMLDLSFKNVRQDIYNIFSWLNYLNERILSVQKQIDSAPQSKVEIKKLIESNYPSEKISKKINELTDQVDQLNRKQKHIPEELDEIRTKLRIIANTDEKHIPSPRIETRTETTKLDEISERLRRMEEHKKKNLRETMVKRITKNSKEYVKNVMVSLIKKYGKIPALKLKEMIVDEQGLCSKSSFYRLLGEVQQEAEVSVANRGKEKQMLFKLTRNN